MAASVNRLMVVNRIQAAATLLIASSAATGSPVSRLKDQLRSKTWRSAIGWTIDANNNKIDFDRGGVKVATLTSGTYATGALLATEIVAALEAADGAPVWACLYDSGTKKFTISSDMSFSLLWNSGANAVVACCYEVGFGDVDTTSAVSHTGGAVYQSRHWLKADLVTAASVLGGIVINHNSGTTGIYTLQGNATDVWTTTPTVNQVLDGDASIRITFISTQTLRYWRLVINDCENPLGYGEVGIWFAGSYVETTRGFGAGWAKDLRPQNDVTFAIGGAHFVDQKADRPVWTAINWPGETAATRDALMAAFAAVPVGTCFFFASDAVDAPTSTEYVMLGEAAGYTHQDGEAFLVKGPTLLGALG